MKKSRLLAAVALWPALLFGLSFAAGAQAKKPAAPLAKAGALPLDPAVRTGKLANGFTYYIRRNTEPKNRVLFYLVNKVGSIVEDDDQRGLAHFMEHMNFNGTTHFPKNELVNYLQKAGVRFGADINAYTGFDETVYQLPLPADKPKILRDGLEIMYDWAQGALLETADIDKERGVVLEEKRLGKGAGERLRRQYLPVVLNHSRYGRRLPIGVDTVLVNFQPETLRRFYHDWYRPDLQALIVVGDIDVPEIEAAIRARFAGLKNPVPERPRPHYAIALTGKNQFIAVTDKEQTSTSIEVLVKHAEVPLKTAADYRAHVVRALFTSMLGARYQELSMQPDPPFLYGSAGISKFLAEIMTYSVSAAVKPGELEKGFKAAWRETERVRRYGFTPAELVRAKSRYRNNLRESRENKAKNNSANYVAEYQSYFLRGEAAPGIEVEFALAQKALNSITVAEVNALTKEYIRSTDRDIVITAPDKDRATLPNQATVQRWMQAVQAEKLTPYNDDFANAPLLRTPPVPGKIVREQTLDSLHATELTLSNGVRVLLKPTDFRNNDVVVSAFSPGGSSLYPDADFESAAYASYLTTMAGIGGYNFQQFGKYLADKRMGIGLYVGDYAEGLDAFATNDNLEDLLQLIHLYFTKPKTDTSAFRNLLTTSRASLANRGRSPSEVFDDTAAAVLGNYSVRRTGPSLHKIDQLNLRRGHQIFRERFANAADFTFLFLGDFDPQKIRPLLEKYLGSLPATNTHEQPKSLRLYPPAGQLTKTVYKGIEPQASVRLVFSGAYAYSPKANENLEALREVLQIRMLERLREAESGVYSPRVNVNYRKLPEQRYSLSISFGCAPESVDRLVASVQDEIRQLKTDGPAEVNVEKFKAEARLDHETQLRTSIFWTTYFARQTLNGDDLNVVLHFDALLQSVSKQSVKEAASQYLSGANMIRLVLLPETALLQGANSPANKN